MKSFPELIKQIRKSANLTQIEFADVLNVSPILIAMIETGKKDVSKNFIVKLANSLDVHPSTITPFLFFEEKKYEPKSKMEESLMKLGEKIQINLIEKKAKIIKKNV